ncbi:RALF-like 1 protein [Nymphaea thermarum]|nr:RALF-like 1 protein [Nymphaea thermarum]
MAIGRLTFLLAVMMVVVSAMVATAGAGLLSGEGGLGWIAARPACDGPMGECFGAEEDEMGMDSETNRRILQASGQYISYGALSRGSIPCSRRGASYYNCRPGAQANPYTRSCNQITRCARG